MKRRYPFFSGSQSHNSCYKVGSEYYVFGRNQNSSLGLGPTVVKHAEKPYNISKYFATKFGWKIKKIAFGNLHTLIITSNNKVFSAGSNEYGQLGNESFKKGSCNRFTIVESLKYHNTFDIGAGYHHSVFQTFKGLFSCGDNKYGKLGLGEDSSILYTVGVPKKVKMAEDVKIIKIRCGAGFSLFLSSLGVLYKTGKIYSSSDTNSFIPMAFKMPEPVTTMCAGHQHVLCLTQSRKVFMYGRSDLGQLSVPQSQSSVGDKPLEMVENKVITELDVKQISLGFHHTYVLSRSGMLFVFGYNLDGQLGISRVRENRRVPYLINHPGEIAQIRACGHSGFFIDTKGSVWCTGRNYDYQCLVSGGKNLKEWKKNEVIPILELVSIKDDDVPFDLLFLKVDKRQFCDIKIFVK